MFMEIAIGAIGIGIVLMVGYLVIGQVRAALPSASVVATTNPCFGLVGTDLTGGATCANVSGTYTGAATCGSTNLTSSNASSVVNCQNVGFEEGSSGVQTTVFAGFGLIAVGIIVLAAFGLINVFK